MGIKSGRLIMTRREVRVGEIANIFELCRNPWGKGEIFGYIVTDWQYDIKMYLS